MRLLASLALVVLWANHITSAQIIQCLSITCPRGMVVECTDPEGTPVFFTADAVNRCGRFLEVTYKPRPGSLFQPGTTTVTATATDGRNKVSCSFEVTVRDTTAPVILAPRVLRVPCDGRAGSRVDFSVSARDNCDAAVTVVCDPPSGSVFPKGTNMVHCTAIDQAGNRQTRSFPVIVEGDCAAQAECLVLECPDDIELVCPDRSGLRVTYRAEVENNCSRIAPVVTYDPPSGTVFPPGESVVRVIAKDALFTRECSFKVILRDEVPPVIKVPDELVVNAQGLAGAVVNFSVTATDNCSDRIAVHSFPPSGSVFPVGQTAVVCEAIDEAGNRAVSGFSVVVRPPAPVQIRPAIDQDVEVKWDYIGQLEFTSTLTPPDWQPWRGPVSSNGLARSAILSSSGSQVYFRIVRSEIAPAADSDGDGVADLEDRCPGTLPGLKVDEHGCSPVQIARSPALVLKGVESRMADAMALLDQTEETEGIRVALAAEIQPISDSAALMREGSVAGAAVSLSNTVASLKNVRDALAADILNFQRNEPRDPQYGDVDEDDFRKENRQIVLKKVSDLVDSAEKAERSFEFTKNSVAEIGPLAGEATEVEDGGRSFKLSGGLHVETASNYQELVVGGSRGTVSGLGIKFDDGTALMTESDRPEAVSTEELLTFDPIRLQIAPFQIFAPGGPWILHNPLGYYALTPSDEGLYFLERGMRFGAAGVKNIPSSTFLFGLRLDLDYITTNSVRRTVTLAPFLEVGDLPISPPSDIDEYPATLTVTKLRVPKLASGEPGTPQVIETETFQIEVNPRYFYARATYLSTIFSLEDSPEETRHGITQVTDMFYAYPLSIFTNRQFVADAYLALGPAGSSYPQAFPITTFIPFAIHDQDFYVHELAPLSELLTGTDKPSGLRWPRLVGYNNGHPYSYAVQVPAISRDWIAGCSDVLGCVNDADTYYRLPFSGGWPTWRMSQGNCGSFTHKNNSRYAYDMPAPTGTHVRAARGGIVTFVREDGDDNCCPDGDCMDNCPYDANTVRITHSDGTIGRYVHMPKNGVFVTVGTRVRRGDLIAKVGNTGFSTGPHLHFEVRASETGPTIPVRFQMWTAEEVIDNFFVPDSPLRNCVQPASGDILFSNNKAWHE